MAFGRFARFTVDVLRGTKVNLAGTLQPAVSYAAVAGLTGLQASILQQSSWTVPTELGMLSSEDWTVVIDADQVAPGLVIREGDRVKRTDLDEQFTVKKVIQADDGQLERAWVLATQRVGAKPG